LAGETEVLGEILLRSHFVNQKSYLLNPGTNPDRRGGKPATNRFSYGAAILSLYTHAFLSTNAYEPLMEAIDGSERNVEFITAVTTKSFVA
jgi:hypothetical protein